MRKGKAKESIESKPLAAREEPVFRTNMPGMIAGNEFSDLKPSQN